MLEKLDEYCLLCERSLSQMTMKDKAQAGQELPKGIDLLETLVGDGCSVLGSGPGSKGVISSSRYVISRNRIFDKTAGTQLWKKMARDQPTHVFLQIGLQTVNPAEAARIAYLCTELSFEQVTSGRHLHMCSHGQMEELEAEALAEVQSGTLLTKFDVSSYSVPSRLKGNRHFRQKTHIHTTSRKLHETMDARYLHKTGMRTYLGHSMSNERFHQRYVLGFDKNFLTYIRSEGHENPAPLEVCCSQRFSRTSEPPTRWDASSQAS